MLSGTGSRIALFLTAITPCLASGQVPSRHAHPTSGSRAVPTAIAVRTTSIIRVDGRLDEPAWIHARAITGFTQSYPNPGATPRESTEVRVLYDNTNLYIGVRAFDNHPDSIAAQLARRDASGIYSDWVNVVIGSYHDRRTAFRFSVNPLGVQQDALEYDDGSNEDVNWDAVWEVATRIDSLGWTAEYRLPLSQLRFGAAPSGEDREWDFQVERDIARYNERDSWAPWTKNSPGYVSSFGLLAGLKDIPMPARLEFLPYASAKLTRAPGAEADPFYRHNDLKPAVGADLKYGLPAGLTLSATINPDFGQVEVDPAVVNLTAFETFFPEKRPFFLEGADIFEFGNLYVDNNYQFPNFFYSRRIGRQPQRSVGGPGVLYVDSPNQTTILGAGKVTGKTGPWTIGLLEALTDRETAQYLTTDGARLVTPVEPLTNYAVGRVQRDFGHGNTAIGAMLTATDRSMSDTVFGSMLRSRADFGGLDFDHHWSQGNWILSGYLAGSHVAGSEAVIASTQRSSTHYFQRPDARYLHYDSTRTSLDGHIGEVAIAKRGALFGSLSYQESSPGFEINDMGYQTRTDFRSTTLDVNYRSSTPGRIFRQYYVWGSAVNAWNYDGNLFYQTNTASANGTFNSMWFIAGWLQYAPELLSDRLTRGGPLALIPSYRQGIVEIRSDSRRPVTVDGFTTYSRDASGGSTLNPQLSFDMRPATFVHVSLGPSLSIVRSTNQYVRSVADLSAANTYGSRYVFADLKQTTLSMDTRLDWTFTTKLSLQLYAQPFTSAGRYFGFKELRAPRTRDYRIYGRDQGTITRDENGTYTVDPDGAGPAPAFKFGDPTFNIRSLRGDAVLRWEYRPGSTLYFVWQQERNGYAPMGDFEFGRDVGAIFRQQPTNVLLIKASYWLNR